MDTPNEKSQPYDPPSSNTQSGTRPSLVSGIRVGDSQAWERLVSCYQPRIVAWCRSRRLDDAATNDVLQEVWIAVAKSLPQFSSNLGRGAFRAWIWRIVQRRMIDFRRQQSRNPESVGGSTMLGRILNVASENDSQSSESRSQESPTMKLNHNLQRVLNQIARDYEARTWQAFLRTAVDGLSTDQVAMEFGMTASGVRQLRSRIFRRIRHEINQLSG